MSVCDLFVVDLRQPVVSCDGAGVGEDQAAYGICDCGILFYTPVLNLYVAVYEVLIVEESGVHVTDLLTLSTVKDVSLCHVIVTHLLERDFHAVLDRLDVYLAVNCFLLAV